MRRTLTDSEGDARITETEQFHDYALALVDDPNATPDPDLPASMDGEKANGFLENTFNYYYARLDTSRTQQQTDTVVLTISENSGGTLDLADVASSFNDARAEIKAAYDALTPDDKQLSLVDAEWIDGGSYVKVKLVYTFEWDVQAGRVNPVIPSNEEWNFNDLGGRRIGTVIDLVGVKGAPQTLSGRSRRPSPAVLSFKEFR